MRESEVGKMETDCGDRHNTASGKCEQSRNFKFGCCVVAYTCCAFERKLGLRLSREVNIVKVRWIQITDASVIDSFCRFFFHCPHLQTVEEGGRQDVCAGFTKSGPCLIFRTCIDAWHGWSLRFRIQKFRKIFGFLYEKQVFGRIYVNKLLKCCVFGVFLAAAR